MVLIEKHQTPFGGYAADFITDGKEKANLLIFGCMASRPEAEVILSRQELEDLRQHLTKLSTPGLEGE